ncbi:hypothetical protein DFJ74DRAFT_418146 [Hyaloraphidium curvatum]|nr:hypothetical protein DFJ74DRAFT_418146 [Hyaloraphidium curvatum]
MRCIQGNLVGTMLTVRLAVTHFLKAGTEGTVLVNSSMGGIMGLWGEPNSEVFGPTTWVGGPQGGYLVAKAALNQLVKVTQGDPENAAAGRGEESKVRVAGLLPTVVLTNIWDKDVFGSMGLKSTEESLIGAFGPGIASYLGGIVPAEAMTDAFISCLEDTEKARGKLWVVSGSKGTMIEYLEPGVIQPVNKALFARG